MKLVNCFRLSASSFACIHAQYYLAISLQSARQKEKREYMGKTLVVLVICRNHEREREEKEREAHLKEEEKRR